MRIGAAHAHLIFFLVNEQARRPGIDEKGGNAFGPFIRIRHGHDDIIIGDAGIGDPGFGTIDDVAAVCLLFSLRAHAGCIGTAIRFGQAKGT